MDERKKWFLDLQELGCIVCLNEHEVISPPDIHHIHRNSRRVDDFHTIPLCPLHHRSGNNSADYISRHPWKKAFEKKYGDEWELFEEVKKRVEDMRKMRKIITKWADDSEN